MGMSLQLSPLREYVPPSIELWGWMWWVHADLHGGRDTV